jgi:hypothetical protein
MEMGNEGKETKDGVGGLEATGISLSAGRC